MEQLTFKEVATEITSNINHESEVSYEGGCIKFVNVGVSVFLDYDLDSISAYIVARDRYSKLISCKTIVVDRETVKSLVEYLDKLIILVENINWDFERLEKLNDEYWFTNVYRIYKWAS